MKQNSVYWSNVMSFAYKNVKRMQIYLMTGEMAMEMLSTP